MGGEALTVFLDSVSTVSTGVSGNSQVTSVCSSQDIWRTLKLGPADGDWEHHFYHKGTKRGLATRIRNIQLSAVLLSLTVMVCTCLAQGGGQLKVWPCWRKSVTLGMGLETLLPPARGCSVCSWLPSGEDVELSAPPAPGLPGCSHVPALMIMDWTSDPVSQPQLNVVLYKTYIGHGVCSQQ